MKKETAIRILKYLAAASLALILIALFAVASAWVANLISEIRR